MSVAVVGQGQVGGEDPATPTTQTVGPISVSLEVTTPESGEMMRSGPDGRIEYMPVGTKATIRLSSRINGQIEASAAIGGVLVEFNDPIALFHSENDVYFLTAGGKPMPFIQDDSYKIPINANKLAPEALLVATWQLRFAQNTEEAIDNVRQYEDADKVKACEVLGLLPHPHAGRVLRELLTSENQQVSTAAGKSLAIWRRWQSLVNGREVVVPPLVLDDAVAAQVNGVSIMQAEVDAFVESRIGVLKAGPEPLPDALILQRARELEVQYVRKLIVEQLLDAKVSELGITVTDQEVLEKVAQLAAAKTPKMTVPQYLQEVRASGEDISVFEKRTKRQVGWDKLVETQIAGQYEVTEEEALAYFNKYPDNFSTMELVKASHILIRPIDENNSNSKAEARASIEKLLKRVKEGADFAELAMDHSEDVSGVHGGSLGYIKRGDMEPPFEKVAFSLPVGQVSDVVETSVGYHIIKVSDHRESTRATFDQVKATLIETLSEHKKEERVRNYFLRLQEDANIIMRKQ